MEYFGVAPDIVTFGKALGAGFPLAATLMSEDYDVLDYGEHELTYGAHPVSCAASLKMIEIIERPGFLDSVRAKSRLIDRSLRRLQENCAAISEVRGVGVIWGIELEYSSVAGSRSVSSLLSRLLEDGLIFRTSKVGFSSNVLQFKPPLTIDEADLETVFTKLGAALSQW
jgi:4-aminobutyrate aminotransferase